VLLDPLEEDLDFPSALIELSDDQSWHNEIVREERKASVLFIIKEFHSAKFVGIFLLRLWAGKDNRLVAS